MRPSEKQLATLYMNKNKNKNKNKIEKQK